MFNSPTNLSVFSILCFVADLTVPSDLNDRWWFVTQTSVCDFTDSNRNVNKIYYNRVFFNILIMEDELVKLKTQLKTARDEISNLRYKSNPQSLNDLSFKVFILFQDHKSIL